MIKSFLSLEEFFDTPLIKRDKHYKGLTTEGQIFANKAKEILNSVQNIYQYFETQKQKNNITVAYSCSFLGFEIDYLPNSSILK